MLPSHIFIVGSGRSGSTLVRRILNRSAHVGISGDTRFLRRNCIQGGYRRQFARIGDLSTDAGATRVVDHIYHEIHGRTFWRWIQKNVDREEFLRRLLESDRTDRALFDLVMAWFAGDRPVRGDKTPPHIHFVPTLLAWYPQAKIVHTLRDPRAVYVSSKRVIARKEIDSRLFRPIRRSDLLVSLVLGLDMAIDWPRLVGLHHQYQDDYPENYRLIKFEDLILQPEAEIRSLCRFLGIDFVEEMLNQRVYNSWFVPRDAPPAGFDRSAIDRWRAYLSPWANRWFVAFCGKELREFGYEP